MLLCNHVNEIYGDPDISSVINLGDTFYTQFTYESDAIDANPDSAFGYYPDALTSMTIIFESGIVFSLAGSGDMIVTDGGGGYGLFSASGELQPVSIFSDVSVASGWDIILWSDELSSLPMPPQVIDTALMHIDAQVGGEHVRIEGTISSPFIPIHTVPEPSIALLLISGLVVFGVARRKARTLRF